MLAYYLALEEQQQVKRQIDKTREEARFVRVIDCLEKLKRLTQVHGLEGFKRWQTTRNTMRSQLNDQVEIQKKIALVLEQEAVAVRGKFSTGTYVYAIATVQG